MRVYQQSPEHTPALFFLPRNTGQFHDVIDAQGNVIGQEEIIAYDIPVSRTVDPVSRTITLERKSKAGIQKLIVDASKQLPIALYNAGVLIAEQAVSIEISDDNGTTWATPATVDKIIDVNNDGVFDALVSVGNSSYLHVDCSWNGFLANPDKQTFTANAPGKLVRVKWIVLVHDPEFNFNYADYKGNVSYSESNGLMEVIFEPAGVADSLVVDPYLKVDETASTITINFSSGDSADFTVATANAYLATNTPAYAFVLEDNHEFHCYDNLVLRKRRNTATITSGFDVTGNTYFTTGNIENIDTTTDNQ